MKITLIRHTSVAVPSGTCYGQADVAVADTFEAEAAAVKSALADKQFDAVFVSPLSRCTKLAAYCGFPHALRDERLMEMNFGDWEMVRWDQINDPQLQLWFDDFLHQRATNGESFADQQQRVAHFLTELKQKPFESVALFVHGGTIAALRVAAGIVPEEQAFTPLTPYGGIVEIEV